MLDADDQTCKLQRRGRATIRSLHSKRQPPQPPGTGARRGRLFTAWSARAVAPAAPSKTYGTLPEATTNKTQKLIPTATGTRSPCRSKPVADRQAGARSLAFSQ